jgi:hypothetical protein
MSKLTLLHINIIGVVVLLIVSVALYFTVITGAQDQIKKNQDTFKGVEDRANKLKTAENNLKTAQADEIKTKADYAIYRKQYTPTIGYTGNRMADLMRYWWPNSGRSFPERFIKGFRAHMNKETRKFGVTWENPEVLTLPANGPDPNSVDMGDNTNKTLVFGPYAMAVRGKSFQDLMRHLADWNTAGGIGVPVIDGLQITGNSPSLTANYNLTWTIILEEPIPPKDPLLGGGSAGGAPGGGGMMGGGPMMGGAVMGSGGPSAMGRRGGGLPTGNSGASMGGGSGGGK